MNGILLAVAMLASSKGASPTLETSRAVVAPPVFSLELPESAFALGDLPRGLLDESPGRRRERGLVRFAHARSAKHSKVDRIIAVAAGVSIGWVVGGGIGYYVTPKRGPYDDTSGLKGMIIGAPIGAAVGALLGWRLTK